MNYPYLKSISKESKISIAWLLLNRLYYRKFKKKNLLTSYKVKIFNLENLESNGLIKIGLDYNGFSNKNDLTLLNLGGKLIFLGNYSIGKGCRVDIAPEAKIEIGRGGYVNSFTKFIISYGLKIGDNCAISWNCQFLDNDYHYLEYDGYTPIKKHNITIGNNVWIGCNASIYKGVNIPDGCVIASDSVVKKSFYEENILIGGNPAEIIKKNIHWK